MGAGMLSGGVAAAEPASDHAPAGEVIDVQGAPRPTGSVLEADPLAASDASVDQAQLALRPRFRTEDVVQEVPGMFAVQHAGGGKADQFFLRGFDLDHGTDVAFSIDGTPINAVSHGHGQGYADLHFLIPETIGVVESNKGPYSPMAGDFATAGSVAFHVLDHVDENYAKFELGPDGHTRLLALDSPDLGPNWKMLAAAEIYREDGPFIHPDGFLRMNALAKATRSFDDGSSFSLSAMAYSGSWNMSGVLPARAVCGEGDGTPTPALYAGSHCISRWDSIDPSQGGASQRYESTATYRRAIPRGEFEATAYALHSNLQLFPNDGIAASFQPAGIQYGSQVEQDDQRLESGVNLRASQHFDIDGTPLRSTFGLQLRNDLVLSQLHRTEQRLRLDGMPGIPGPIVDSDINETETGAYVQEDWRPQKWLRVVLGGRADRVDVDVNNESPTAADKVSGYRGQSQLSPKATVVVSAASDLDLFANFGRGFHSNDARTLIAGSATTLLATATGYEVGATVRPAAGASISAVAFLLDLSSEQTIDGDTASTSPAGPTRRYGAEISARYLFRDQIFAEGTYTYAHARYTDAADIAAGQSIVALAPVHTLSAAIGAREHVGPTLVSGSVNVRAMSDRPGNEDGSLVATGFVLFNADLGVRWNRFELGADVLNIANTSWREGQFAVDSRLPGEGPAPATGMSFTPGIPRTFLVHAIVRFP